MSRDPFSHEPHDARELRRDAPASRTERLRKSTASDGRDSRNHTTEPSVDRENTEARKRYSIRDEREDLPGAYYVRDGDAALKTIRMSADVPAPNFVLDTSPGKHQVVWKVSGVNQDEAESLLRGLANQFGGDLAATDSTRVLRLPGFVNRKLPEEFIVRARQESEAVYQIRDFAIHEGQAAAAPDRASARAPMPENHKSQSERDWAYAKRALARGDDSELVIRTIADYRSDDKSDPNYYARRTVTKARAELDQEPSKSK